jgi:Holliday junction resolvasome RuvABC endonuclease subunit
MEVIGVDCSTRKIALFSIYGKGISTVQELVSAEEDTPSRINDMFLQVYGFFLIRKPTIVIVENSPYLQNIKVTLAIHSVVDAVRFACVLNKVPFQTVEVTSWKKDVLGNGRADKAMIMQFAKAKFGVKLITNQDVADASCIATWGALRLK